MRILLIIITFIVAAVLYAIINVANRRWDAFIRAREDYDEDVDGKQTKAEKAAFEEKKAEEAKLIKMPAADVYKERPKRCIAVIIWGLFISVFTAVHFEMHSMEWKTNFVAGCGAAILIILFAIYTLEALIDFDTMEIPPTLNIAIFVLGLISIPLWPHVSIKERIIGMLCITVPMLLLDFILPGAFGGGDRRMLYGTGFLLGWQILVVGFFIGAVIQALVAVILMLTKKKGWKSHIPFGPMLCLGMIISCFVGNGLIEWYINVLKTAMGN